MGECHSTLLDGIAHDGNTVRHHLEAMSLDMLMKPLPAICLVLWFIMFELKFCFCNDQRSCATEMPTWAHHTSILDGCLYAWKASPPHTPGKQLSHTQEEIRVGCSVDSTIWNQDYKWRRCSLTWGITKIQTTGDVKGQQDLAAVVG